VIDGIGRRAVDDTFPIGLNRVRKNTGAYCNSSPAVRCPKSDLEDKTLLL
jgi:hypothetical protein